MRTAPGYGAGGSRGCGWQSGLTYELAAATVEYGQQVGARVLEGYPIEPPSGRSVIWDEASVGLVQAFLEAGYEVVASPTLRGAWCGDD